MTTNRLAEHFAAITTPRPFPSPPPRRGYDHFAFGVFDPRKYRDTWTARNDEDSPTTLKYEDVDFRARYHPNAIADALRWVKAFNSSRFADRLAGEWALLAWVDGAYESVRIPYARCVTPLEYVTHQILTPPHWHPANLLDTPSELWNDEPGNLWPTTKDKHHGPEEAVTAAVSANRKFRPGKRRKGGWPQRWMLVLAIEIDPLNSFNALNCSGRRGTMTKTENHRFHLVDATWPLAPETLAAVKGGAL